MKYVIIAILICGLVGAGYYFMAVATKPQQMQQPKTPITQQPQKTMFGSIKDALTKAVSLKCEYDDDKGVHTVTYIKAGSVRVMTSKTTTTKSEANDIILKDKTMYMWNPQTKKGFSYSFESQTVVSTAPTQAATSPSMMVSPAAGDKKEEFLAMLNKFKDSCAQASVEDSMFVPPEDVQFQNMDSMMKGMMPSGVPSGMPNADTIKQMMQQGGPTQGTEQ